MSQLPMSANLKNNKGDQQSRNERHTFVLVHGGWCGGWIWRYVAPALREQGHVVTTPTLTDLGERRHLENRTATLSTHIEDVVAHIEMEGFQDVILVSQSYGGMVATGTLARIPDRIRSMIVIVSAPISLIQETPSTGYMMLVIAIDDVHHESASRPGAYFKKSRP
jgi:pimeloyl-ACP methyl ester carboxylesterase